MVYQHLESFESNLNRHLLGGEYKSLNLIQAEPSYRKCGHVIYWYESECIHLGRFEALQYMNITRTDDPKFS